MIGNLMTPKQEAFIRDLINKREMSDDARTEALFRLDNSPRLTMPEASRWIDRLKELPRARAGDSPEPEAGMYRQPDGTIVRVYLGQQSGKMLMKRVRVAEGNHGSPDDYTYEYVGLASKNLGDAKRMSLDEAKAWGKMTGHCCVCGRRLDVPESVEAGIGPVCAGRV